MGRLNFLASALSKGVVGHARGKREGEERAYTKNLRQEEMQERRDRSRAMAEYNDSIAQTRRMEAQARITKANTDAADDELRDEKLRLEVDRLRHPNKYRPAPQPRQTTGREQMQGEAMKFRDSLVAQGMPVDQANAKMRAQFPLLGGTTMEDIIAGIMAGQRPPAPRDSTP